MKLLSRAPASKDRFVVYSDCEQQSKEDYNPIPIWESLRNKDVIDAGSGRIQLRASSIHEERSLNFTDILPFASKEYQISSDPKDYFVVPVVIFTADLPNLNCIAFPRKELVRFQPEYGCLAYETWRGKPVYSEHANKDITKSHGIIIDSFLRKTPNFGGKQGIWKVINLLAIDRTKYSQRASQVLSGQVRTFSMGAYCGDFFCPVTGLPVTQSPHFRGKLHNEFLLEPVHGSNKLLFRNVSNIVGFETSIVDSPAFLMAQTDPDFHMEMK